jgi:uncharacterized repeat protein (TIGR03803 family)
MKRLALLAMVACLGLLADASLMAAVTLTTLHVFNGADGNAPQAGLAFGTNGNLWGTTSYGGTGTNVCVDGCGTVFEISLSGAFTSRHSFTNADGESPRAGLVQASDGNLYGTTAYGGTFAGHGTVYRITPAGVLTNLHTFRGNEGTALEGTLIEGPNGILYGTTAGGGVISAGTVFQITTNGVFAALNANPSTGLNQPAAGVVLASDGNLYGTSEFGGTSTNCIGGCGAIYRITPGGVVTTLHSFDKSDGQSPKSVLVEGPGGILYGTTYGSPLSVLNCANGCGTIFQITTNGGFTTLHTFAGPEGKLPEAGLVFGSDGNLYGTGSRGGTLTFGTVFQVTTNGIVTRLVSFTGTNGGVPVAPLILGPDGAFYGTTLVGGGTNGAGLGTVFKLTVSTNASTVSCVLSPASATNIVGTAHTVTATVTSNGVPRSGAVVNFSVTAGPNLGKTGTATTIAGQASFTYTGSTTAGTDTIRATSLGATGTATKVWIAPDSVGDGIPDWWRAQYFGGNGTTTNNQSCAACDADGTGQNNLFKYVAGLDPTNAASAFVFSIQDVNGTQKSLTYGSIAAGRIYTPQFRTNLLTGNWGPLTFSDPTTNNNQVTITDPNATQTTRFYRIGISFP